MLSSILAFLFGVLSSLINGVKLVSCPEAWGSVALLLFLFLLTAVWLASGFLGATVAELSGNPAPKHFFLSLLLPYFYPVYLMGHIQRREAAEEEATEDLHSLARSATSNRFNEARAERLAARKGVSVEEARRELDAECAAPKIPVAPESDSDSSYDMAYFDALPVDKSGLRPGPFGVVARDGRQFQVEAVKALQPEVLVMISGGKTIRIRYSEIVRFDVIQKN